MVFLCPLLHKSSQSNSMHRFNFWNITGTSSLQTVGVPLQISWTPSNPEEINEDSITAIYLTFGCTATWVEGWFTVKEGCKILVQHVLMLIWRWPLISHRGHQGNRQHKKRFLCRGKKDAKGGHCLVAWPKICLPKELGHWVVLGFPIFKIWTGHWEWGGCG